MTSTQPSTSRTRPGLALSALIALGLTSACAPDTIIRRTALINAPQGPTREGLPLEKGQVRLSAHLSGLNAADEGGFFLFDPGVAEVGDPGVLIPDFHVGASLWAGLPGGLEIGGQFYYAAMTWADPNVMGVIPFPDNEEEDLFMGGLGLRLNVDTGAPQLALAMMVDLNLATIPEAIFICASEDPEVCSGQRLVGEEVYRFDRTERETFLLPNFALQIGWRPLLEQGADPKMDGEDTVGAFTVMPYLLLGLQSSVTNTGFENDLSTLPDDSLESLWMGYIGVGVDATFQGLAFGASVILPIEGERAIDFGAIFNLKLGAHFE